MKRKQNQFFHYADFWGRVMTTTITKMSAMPHNSTALSVSLIKRTPNTTADNGSKLATSDAMDAEIISRLLR